MSKKWILTPSPPPEFFSEHPELPSIIVRLLWNRNLKTQEQIDEFLNPDYGVDLHDPFLFKDMPKAIELIFDCIKNNKKIPLPGILIYVKDKTGKPVRLLKTNPHGIFASFHPIPEGEYTIETKDPKGGYFFDTMKLTITKEHPKQLEIFSKELL
jgi:hypothetical protein